MSTKSVVGDCRLERSASEGPSGLRIKTLPIARVRRLGATRIESTGRRVVSKRGASGPPGLTRRGDRGIKSPSARFRNWRRGGLLRRRGRRLYVLFDQVPKHYREQHGHQLRAPVFQGQSGAQDGKQLRGPVFRGQSLHNCCAAKFPRCIDETSPE